MKKIYTIKLRCGSLPISEIGSRYETQFVHDYKLIA